MCFKAQFQISRSLLQALASKNTAHVQPDNSATIAYGAWDLPWGCKEVTRYNGVSVALVGVGESPEKTISSTLCGFVCILI